MKSFLLLLTLSLFIGCSAKKNNEKYYQTIFCEKMNGVVEYHLKDRTRVDCLTDEYAIEIDWAKKWAEAIGQSLYYAYMTNKKPAIGLIIADNEQSFVHRVNIVANQVGIKVFILNK